MQYAQGHEFDLQHSNQKKETNHSKEKQIQQPLGIKDTLAKVLFYGSMNKVKRKLGMCVLELLIFNCYAITNTSELLNFFVIQFMSKDSTPLLYSKRINANYLPGFVLCTGDLTQNMVFGLMELSVYEDK